MTPLGLANLMVDVAKNHMYWDCCRVCMDRGDMTPYPPEGVDEQKTRDGWFTFMYRCRAGRTWTCGYAAPVLKAESQMMEKDFRSKVLEELFHGNR